MSRSLRRAIVDFNEDEAGPSVATNATARRRGRIDSEAEEEEGEVSAETDLLINTAVRYVLLHQMGHKQVQRTDINKLLTEHHTVSKKTLATIMNEVGFRYTQS